MLELTGLNQILDGERGERQAELIRCGSEGMQAPSLTGAQFSANCGERVFPHDRRKCLRKSIDGRDDSDGPGEPSTIAQIRNQRRWQ